ncbi:hypothetical protein EK386_00615 [Lysinibacillus antri]|uniref:Uncharacterized protein n=1 Tax=Lysinibacillus antri TaxID=2498145 RepID=A0A3S0P8L4_9BACI|nr:hypothetical protein EK386_00615 [Lysinibacillus antri]TSI08554.1 hypothetical protein FJQ64_06260 [Lysinibacillus sp. BW-2-10]
MYQYLMSNEGGSYLVAIILLFVTTFFVSYYIFSFETQINVYNSLEFANVRATINLLEEIGSK